MRSGPGYEPDRRRTSVVLHRTSNFLTEICASIHAVRNRETDILICPSLFAFSKDKMHGCIS